MILHNLTEGSLSLCERTMAVRSRNSNLRPRPTYPGVAILRGFESVGPDRPTRRAERGEEILGRNDPTDRPSTARSTVIFESERPDRPTHFRQARGCSAKVGVEAVCRP